MDADLKPDPARPPAQPPDSAGADTEPLALRAEDIAPEERDRAAEALRRFRVRRVRGPGPAFERAYHVLHEEFGPRGEIEAHDDLAHDIVHALHETGGTISYELMTFHDADSPDPDDPDGRLAGVRDVFTCYLPGARLPDGGTGPGSVVVLLSHSLILPPWRRSGLGALIRAAPALIGRRRLREAEGRAGGREGQAGGSIEGREGSPGGLVALVAEMDPISPAQDATLIRYLAYCRSGFVVVPAQEILYFQPDFSVPDPTIPRRGLPMTLVVRIVDDADNVGVNLKSDTSNVEDDTYTRIPAHQMRTIYESLTQIHLRHYAPCAAYRAALAADRLAEERPYRAIRVRRDRLSAAIPLLRGEMLPRFDARSGGIDAYPQEALEAERQALLLK